MKRVMIRSVFDAFQYVMEHYYPVGLRDLAQRSDNYAVISVQDTHMRGFGVTFAENQFCKGVLTLYFDDIEHEVDNAMLFTNEMAEQIIDFIWTHRKDIDTLLVHCYAGQSRSRAIGAFVVKMFGWNNQRYFNMGGLNKYVYDTLETAWIRLADRLDS